jgi:Fe-S-cluster containining protein
VSTLRRFLARGTPFSYACQGCGRCCHDKRITLSPYEIARLAHARGLSTRELLERHTDEGGTVLLFDDVRGCTFLSDGKCTAHEGRPLVCRLYPLGRVVKDDQEAFVELEPHPETEGIYGEAGTVDAWAERQGALPFIETAARYHALLMRLAAILTARESGRESFEAALKTSEPVASDWQDVDAVVQEACRAQGIPTPNDVERRIELHLSEMDRWVASFEVNERH